MPPLQNNRQFIPIMMSQGKMKRKLEDDINLSNTKIRRITIKNEPKQSLNNFLFSILFGHVTDQSTVMYSNFICHSLSPTEETFILDAIARSSPDCTFFHAK
ncbi:unnamed protein product [Rotaria sp. Silwood1]|nr:unnamed protein product [Rotaria sp. Silwood1]CAF1670896.1 unnamed protein product [Rotaria sp. Silwood1]CAF3858731.1 unnamed protein product [Rotaria sp. Silwood1]CAF3906829.1 unnamed protein product [Rotaria sp. Silwood1]CAF4900823.1 unnamed protein product [Rotaria sp. Silwood1]